MCNRESFILLPKETGYPVAWSVSYHHSIILRQLKYLIGAVDRPLDYVQIECKGGNISGWDWDNTPMITRISLADADAGTAIFYPSSKDFADKIMLIKKEQSPDIPSWLEDNLKSYQDRVERILERLNPLRDRQERLNRSLGYPSIYALAGPSEIDTNLDKNYQDDSPEVKEFEFIVNGYRLIDGFAYTMPMDADYSVAAFTTFGYFAKPNKVVGP